MKTIYFQNGNTLRINKATFDALNEAIKNGIKGFQPYGVKDVVLMIINTDHIDYIK